MKTIERKQSSSEMRDMFGTQNDHAQMFQMIWGFTISQIVHAVALYSLPEHLGEGRATPAEIAEAESLNVAAVFRLMRACASIGLLTYDGLSKFAATPLLNTLHKDAPNSIRGAALLIPGRGQWLPWGNLSDALKTGEPQSVPTLGRTAWQYLADTPADAAAFTETMKSTSLVIDREAAKLVDTKSVGVAVDVGGASGTLIQSLMKENPALHGVVFDLSHIVASATKAAEELGLQGRFSAVAGDFFVSVPPADLYLLKLILHDWDDDACISILRNCRRAIHPGGRVVVVEMLLDEIGTPSFAPLMDLNMLVLLGGRERNLEEFKALFAAGGFRFSRSISTSTPFVLIEALAV